MREVQINDIIEETVSTSEQRAKESNVKIVTHLDQELPKVSASPSEMQQVFLNLINNATAREGVRFGAFDYLTKPCDLDDLIDVICKACNRETPKISVHDKH